MTAGRIADHCQVPAGRVVSNQTEFVLSMDIARADQRLPGLAGCEVIAQVDVQL